ncbi:hypothetical protein [Synechococcus sp. PCC 7336]|uniref:Hfq-related RNA-binding protein n=1 Tax=Synechococcus sp. PCC 7336 TaxID=195250 RepID=UPI00034C9B21|nr:hypothetical protein [Synechococcus sp. PCC 7336]
MTELNTSIPSTRWLQALIQTHRTVEIKLQTSDLIAGSIQWIDPDCICLIDSSGAEQLIWRQAIAIVRPI